MHTRRDELRESDEVGFEREGVRWVGDKDGDSRELVPPGVEVVREGETEG